MTISRFLAVALLIAGAAAGALAQAGDRGREQPEVWREMAVPAAPARSAAEELETFRVAPGFRVELVAAEPLVADPVAMAWDAEGRMWVVEMRGFMPNVEGTGEDAPKGRVAVLEDVDGDGRMDKRTVFLDGLVMPRAIAIVHEAPGETGVLVGEPPHLWYCVDTDGDLKIDEKTEVYDSYGRQGPVEHTDNGLMHGLDNWMYNAKSDERYRFRDGELIVDETAFRGQWGITQDSYGRLYTNTNSSFLHADLLPADYLLRNPHYETDAGITENIVDDQSVHTIRVNPGINRGYLDRMLREDGRLARTTAVCGPVIYRGDQFPARFRGDAFVPEPAGNVVARFRIEEEGVKLDAEHVLYEGAAYEKREFLASTDERFRPVQAYNGPDGALYIVDMYRGILQHKVYVTTFLRKQILERGLDDPAGKLGRIWRVVYEGERTGEAGGGAPKLGGASSRELVGHLSDENGWVRDTAQRLLVGRDDPEAVEPLRSLAVNGGGHLGRIHALWTLRGMGALGRATVLAAMGDSHPKVRRQAVRAGEALLGGAGHGGAGPRRLGDSPSDLGVDGEAFVEKLVGMIGDADAGVRLQAMLTLGEVKGSARAAAEAAMAALLVEDGGEPYMVEAAVSGLGGRELAFVQTLMGEGAFSSEKAGRADVLGDLAATIYRRRDADEVAALLAMAAELAAADWQRAAVLGGILGSAKEPEPIEMAREPGALATLIGSEDETVRRRAEEVAKLIDVGGRKMAEKEGAGSLTAAQRELMRTGETMYMATCMACHQADGEGQVGIAPPLAGSDWATGSEERLIRIALNGLQGPITVEGEEWNLVMPGHRHNPALTDERIAGILTYIRRSWGNEASAVSPGKVKAVREATAGQTLPWTAEELEGVE